MEHAFRRGVKPVGRRGPLAKTRVAWHPSVAGLPESASMLVWARIERHVTDGHAEEDRGNA